MYHANHEIEILSNSCYCYAVELSIAPAKLLNWNIDWLCMPAQLRWLKPMSSGNEKYLALPRILADPSCRRGHVPSRKVGSAHSIVFPPYMSRPCKYWKLNCQFTTYTLACGDSDWWNTIFRFVNFPIPIWFSKHGVYNKLWELPMYELAVLDLLWWVTW